MAQGTAIGLTGDDLTVEDVWSVAVERAPAELSDEARAKMRAARAIVEQAAHGTREHTYGVNTGFGRFVSRSIPEELTGELQLRLLRSHACGVGDPYPDEVVRARRLSQAADLACAQSLEALQGTSTSFLPQIHALRRLKGQADSAANVLRLLQGSAILESHRWCDKVQDAYSLRCAPQVHGAARDLLDYATYTVETELNSATDNPLVLVEDGILVSNGNFHGQPLAFALDALAMAVSELADIAERRGRPPLHPTPLCGLPSLP